MSKSIKLIREQKEEYMDHIFDLIYEPIYKLYKSIYQGNLSSKEASQHGILKSFQKDLAKIPEWNQLKVESSYKEFIKASNCKYFPELLKTIYILSVKLVLLGLPEENRNKIKIKVPDAETFYHRLLIHIARDIWKRPFLFYHQVKSVEQQNHLYQFELIIRRKIRSVIRDTLPIELMVQQMSHSELLEQSESESDSDSDAGSEEHEPESESEESEESEKPESESEESEEPKSESESEEPESELDEDDEADEDVSKIDNTIATHTDTEDDEVIPFINEEIVKDKDKDPNESSVEIIKNEQDTILIVQDNSSSNATIEPESDSDPDPESELEPVLKPSSNQDEKESSLKTTLSEIKFVETIDINSDADNESIDIIVNNDKNDTLILENKPLFIEPVTIYEESIEKTPKKKLIHIHELIKHKRKPLRPKHSFF